MSSDCEPAWPEARRPDTDTLPDISQYQETTVSDQQAACGCAEAADADRELDRRIAALGTPPTICGDRCESWPETICTEPPRHRMPHGGPLIIDGSQRGGASWGAVDGYAEPPNHVNIPVSAYQQLVAIARHVSLGRAAANLTPYPDALARRTLGALNDAGLLDTKEQQ